MISAISVGCEVTPSNCEWSTHRPCVAGRIVDLHLISWGVKIPTQDIHLVTEVNRPSVARGVGYRGNRGDGISRRIIDKRVCRIGENTSGDISAATCVDQTSDGGSRYVTERNWQDGSLLHPAGGVRRKLPNLVGPEPIRNVEATQNDERVVENSEATRQNARVARRPVTSNGGDAVSNRIIAEDTTARAVWVAKLEPPTQ